MRSNRLFSRCLLVLLAALPQGIALAEQPQAPAISQQVKTFLETSEDRLKNRNEAHYFFLAMCAQQQGSPVAVGRRIIENFNAFEKVDASGCAGTRFTSLLPRGFPCDFGDQECYLEFLERSGNRLRDVERFKETLLLYNKFIAFRSYATLSRPKLNAPRGQFAILRVGSLLRTMDILRYARQEDPRAAARALISDIRNLRNMLAQADTLRLKSHLAFFINRNLEALKFLKDRYALRQVQRIAPITRSEAGFELIVAREFSENYHTVYNQDAAAIMRLLAGGDDEAETAMAAKRLSRGYEDQYDRIATINDIGVLYAQLLSVSPLDEQWNFQVSKQIDDLKTAYTRKYVRNNNIAQNAIGFGIIRSTIENFYFPYLKLNQVLIDINININKLSR